MTKQAVSLPKNVSILQDMVRHRDEEIEILREQVRSLKHTIFGPKSEVLKGEAAQLQRSLFEIDAPEDLQPEEHDTASEPDSGSARPRRARGRRRLPGFLPREEIIHDLPEGEKRCSCGHQKACIGQTTSEVLERVPTQYSVKVHTRLKYACKNPQCGLMLEGREGMVAIAAGPQRMIPQSMAGHSLLAHVAATKFVDGLPFYRVEKQLQREGLALPRQTMSRWIIMIAERLRPLWQRCLQAIKTHPYL